jgi:hypothetical protein
MESSALEELNEKRRALRPLLSPHDPADALASYYALWHDPRRTRLALSRDVQGRADGFAAVCQTGADLFRPLVTLRAPDADAAGRLLREALTPGRPYHVMVPVTLAAVVREHLEIEHDRLLQIRRLEPARFQRVINVLVQQVRAADGAPRFQIESQGQVVAVSGTNWRSPTFAEVFVHVEPSGRHRGWGKSVAAACTSALLEERLRPLYLVEAGNGESRRLAEELGYLDTGLREFAAEARPKSPTP